MERIRIWLSSLRLVALSYSVYINILPRHYRGITLARLVHLKSGHEAIGAWILFVQCCYNVSPMIIRIILCIEYLCK